MTDVQSIAASAYNCTLFTLNINDKIYQWPVSTEALYMLCRDQDASLNQLDAYLQLKMKIQRAVERRLARGKVDEPTLLRPADFGAD